MKQWHNRPKPWQPSSQRLKLYSDMGLTLFGRFGTYGVSRIISILIFPCLLADDKRVFFLDRRGRSLTPTERFMLFKRGSRFGNALPAAAAYGTRAKLEERYHLYKSSVLITIGWNKEAAEELKLINSFPDYRLRQVYYDILQAQAYTNRGMYELACSRLTKQYARWKASSYGSCLRCRRDEA